MTPIVEYLRDGTLPDDKKEASKLRIKARQYELVEGVLYRRSFLTPWLRIKGEKRPVIGSWVLLGGKNGFGKYGKDLASHKTAYFDRIPAKVETPQENVRNVIAGTHPLGEFLRFTVNKTIPLKDANIQNLNDLIGEIFHVATFLL
ncbi:hypothetical protein Tco_0791735 [Tanacetum coccineum]